LELEYTFLAKEIPQQVKDVRPQRLMDVYIPESDTDHARLRLRQKDDSYQITKKTRLNPDDASSQIESTIELDQKEFQALSSVSQKRIVKDRYLIDINGRSAEVDIFREKLAGLVLIDFEFSNEQDRATFTTPDICLADVTQEDFIAGGVLSGQSYTDIQDHLNRYNYQPLS